MPTAAKRPTNGQAYTLDPSQNPVLNTPYEVTRRHWALSVSNRAMKGIKPGRRPSMGLMSVPEPDAGDQQALEIPDDLLNRTVNDIRDAVGEWRLADYPGVSAATGRLLRHWNREDHDKRLFFAQLEAIETLIWLTETADHHKPSKVLKNRIVGRSRDANDGLVRYAVKMATGTGKTVVMAMVILWHAVNSTSGDGRWHTNFLVIAPGHTVRDRLSVLIPKGLDRKRTFYDEFNLIPNEAARRSLSRIRVKVRNFQAFQRRDWLGRYATGDAKRLLRGNAEKEPESSKAMLARVLRGMFNPDTPQPICVLNDEAHHCYLPEKNKRTGPERGDDKHAALWFNALAALRKEGAITGPVYDFSATPMFITTAARNEVEMFPWVVSDYPLMDAIEAGLVKVPRVPVSDDAETPEPVWRNLYKHTEPKKLSRYGLPHTLSGALDALYDNYEETHEKWKKMPTPPVFIVVANDVANAEALCEYLAGWQNGDVCVEGAKKLFSNYAAGTDGVIRAGRVRTLLVHSKIENDETLTGAIGAAIRRQSEMLQQEGATAGDPKSVMREALNTIGEPGAAGEQIRCVVSVSMLTEGWDTRTVTHILGYRAFSTQLLCEQVTGRALRRPSYDNFDESGSRLDVEFAEVLGVPYDFMPSTGKTEPKTPVSCYEVRSQNHKRRHRIEFPSLTGYRLGKPARDVSLNPDKVGQYNPPSVPQITELAGVGGETELLMAEHGSDWRNQRIKVHLAADVSELLEQLVAREAEALLSEGDNPDDGLRVCLPDRRVLFRASYQAAEEWLAHPNVNLPDVPWVLAYPDIRKKAAQHVFSACVPGPSRAKAPVVGSFEQNPYTDTSDVLFETSLTNRYPQKGKTAARSELNIAACHSQFEVRTAEILDRQPDITAWARNFKLGWEVPYLSAKGVWHSYVPDFVVRLFGGYENPDAVHLIVECKGVPDRTSETKHRFLRKWWIPAVAQAGAALPEHLKRWDFVELRSVANIRADLDAAIERARHATDQAVARAATRAASTVSA